MMSDQHTSKITPAAHQRMQSKTAEQQLGEAMRETRGLVADTAAASSLEDSARRLNTAVSVFTIIECMDKIALDAQGSAAKLRAVGFDEKQAETVVCVLAEAQDSVVSRDHFDAQFGSMRTEMEAGFALLRADIAHTRWVLGAVFALVATNIAQQVF